MYRTLRIAITAGTCAFAATLACAALGEALKECRAMQAGRSDCVSQANAEHRRDMEDARRLLVNSGSPAPK